MRQAGGRYRRPHDLVHAQRRGALGRRRSRHSPSLGHSRNNRTDGTKFGCGIAQCGACTVHMNGMTRRSCVTPISTVDGADIVTIEGVNGPETDAVRAAWASIDVPQCGYCQSGQIMSAVNLLQNLPKPTDADIDGAMAG